MINQKIIDHVFLRNNLLNYEYELKEGSRIVYVSPMTSIQFDSNRRPELLPNSVHQQAHVYLELFFRDRPYISQYQFNAAERLGNALLTPLATSIALISDKTGRVPTFAKVIAKISLIFTATIGLIGAALKAAGEYFNPNKASYQAARQACFNLRKARMELISIDMEIQAELKRGVREEIDMQSLNTKRENCLVSVKIAVEAFNKATNCLRSPDRGNIDDPNARDALLRDLVRTSE